MKFKSQDEALQYSIHNQRDRRNMTDDVLLRCIEAVDKRKKQGARTDLASSGTKSGKSSEETARIVGTSRSKVEKVRAIIKDDKKKAEVLAGRMTINKPIRKSKGPRSYRENGAGGSSLFR